MLQNKDFLGQSVGNGSGSDEIKKPEMVPSHPIVRAMGAGSMIPSFKHGGDVEKTGPALVHKGEHVISKEHMDRMKLAAHALGHKSEDKPSKKIKHVIVTKAHGGHIIHHVHENPEHDGDPHVTTGNDGMVNHMLEHMGEPNPGEAEADQGQSGIPSTPPGE